MIAWNFNAEDVFSKYIIHVRNVETLLKVFRCILRPSVPDTFALMSLWWEYEQMI